MKTKHVEFIVFGLGIAASVLLLLNSFKIGEELLSGFKLAFGGKYELSTSIISADVGKFNFNILLSLAILLPALGAVIQTFVTEPFGGVVAIILFIAAFVIALTVKEVEFVENLFDTTHKLDIKLATLGIISIVLTGLATLFTGYKLMNK